MVWQRQRVWLSTSAPGQRIGLGLEPARVAMSVTADTEPSRILEVWRRDPHRRIAAMDGALVEQLYHQDPAFRRQLTHLPLPIEEAFFIPGNRALVADVAHRLHLEQRPRWLYVGSYQHGSLLTALLEAARADLALGGELVLVDSLGIREHWAPVVQHLGLAETVIFTPPLDDASMAGLFHGADVLIDTEGPQYPLWLSYAQAAGLPTVCLHTPTTEYASGRAALLVPPGGAWPAAIHTATTNTRVRETMIGRGLTYAADCHAANLVDSCLQWLHP